MTDVSRRILLAGAGILTTAALEDPASACSLTGRLRPVSFSDRTCRRSLQDLASLIDQASELADALLIDRLAELSINFDTDVTEPIMGYPNHSVENDALIRAWSMSDGKRDQTPIRIFEANLLKHERGVALYQFTLRRSRFYREITPEEAAGDSCGMAEPAHYGQHTASYLGIFHNNKLRQVSAFDAWLEQL